jgi:hypothetical protein
MSADMPVGAVYRAENVGTGPLELVAIRFG